MSACFGNQIQGDKPWQDVALTTKLGSTLDIFDTDADGEWQTMLDVSLNEYPSQAAKVFDPGSWILTFQTRVLREAQPFPGINPLVARVEYGAGSARTTVEVTISPGSAFQISADRLRADVRLENLIGVTPLQLPLEQRVSAFLRRGTLVTIPVRSIFVAELGAGMSLPGAVPPLASDVFLHTDANSNAYTAATTLLIGSNAAVLAEYDGTQLRAAQLSGNPLPVPAGSTSWTLVAVNAIVFPFALEFGLEL